MKIKLLAAGLMLALILPISACAANEPSPQTIEVPIEDFYNQPQINDDEITVTVGDTFVLRLGSNASTGYAWSEEASTAGTSSHSDGNLTQLSHAYIPSESQADGAPGTEEWTFEALRPGLAFVYLEYSQPWEGGDTVVWTYFLKVTITEQTGDSP